MKRLRVWFWGELFVYSPHRFPGLTRWLYIKYLQARKS